MFGIEEEKIMSKLWGDVFFDPATRKWTTKPTDSDGNSFERAFNMFVLDPIFRLRDAIMDSDTEKIVSMLEKLYIPLSSDDRALERTALFKVVMCKFLPAEDALLEMVAIHLPSPVVAQRYRVEALYEGPMDDETAIAIHDCDPNSSLCLYVPEMVPSTDKGLALGRVFSGTISAGLEVRIQSPEYVPGKKDSLSVRSAPTSYEQQAHPNR